MTLNIVDLWIAGALVLTVALGSAFISTRNNRRKRLAQRLGQAAVAARKTAHHRADTPVQGLKASTSHALQTLGRLLPLFDAGQRREMERKLASAGHRGASALSILMGLSGASALFWAFMVMTVGWPLMGSGNTALRIVVLLAAGYIGLLMPRLVLDRLVARRQRAIQRSFPDALDLLVVCTNAGLGLNAALQRVAAELEHLAPELADELTLTSQQLQLSGDTADILREMAERINLSSIRSLVATLIQSRQFGTPIGQALRVLSQGERAARLMRTEEAAAKLATKITIPMMFFILPTVLIVGAGPAFLQLMETLAQR